MNKYCKNCEHSICHKSRGMKWYYCNMHKFRVKPLQLCGKYKYRLTIKL